MLNNPFHDLTRFEKALWITSLIVVTLSYLLAPDKNYLTLAASLFGVTALIFVAKGYVFGQLLSVFFALFYGYVSMHYHYYGEMITYFGMSAPISIITVISWIRNPFKKTREVAIRSMTKFDILIMSLLTVAVTTAFFFILRALNTANLYFSTVSIATSFLASFMTFKRSPFYAVGYILNDFVLIVLWILATIQDPSYFPMIFCFVMFLFNDCYGYFNWQRIKKRQNI